MSVNTEWLLARETIAEYTHHEDSYGQTSDGPALLLSGDDVVAVEGTRGEIAAMLRRALATVTVGSGRPRVEVVHSRDPDGECTVSLFIDGREVTVDSVYDVDPGRSGDVDEWREALATAEDNPRMSDAARSRTVATWASIIDD